jgi:hypothetical protein
MNLTALLSAGRDDLDDTVAPYFHSDARLTRFLNEAQREAARRARLITDSSTAAVCQIPIVAGTALYALDPRVIYVKRAQLLSQSDKLIKVTVLQLDSGCAGWQTQEATPPTHWVPDFESGKIRLFPIPKANDTLYLTVIREPLVDMSGSLAPEIAPRYHENLVHWMRYRAYMVRDAETYDPKKAAEALQLFEAEFGPATNAQNEVFNHERHGQDDYEGSY